MRDSRHTVRASSLDMLHGGARELLTRASARGVLGGRLSAVGSSLSGPSDGLSLAPPKAGGADRSSRHWSSLGSVAEVALGVLVPLRPLRPRVAPVSHAEDLVTPPDLSPSATALGAAVVCLAKDPALRRPLAVALRALHPWIELHRHGIAADHDRDQKKQKYYRHGASSPSAINERNSMARPGAQNFFDLVSNTSGKPRNLPGLSSRHSYGEPGERCRTDHFGQPSRRWTTRAAAGRRTRGPGAQNFLAVRRTRGPGAQNFLAVSNPNTHAARTRTARTKPVYAASPRRRLSIPEVAEKSPLAGKPLEGVATAILEGKA
jgi:hypothetical protein